MKIFRLMKIKMKIAYAALQAGQPVLDFVINAVLKAFVEKLIPRNKDNFLLDDNVYFKWSTAFRREHE